MSFHKALKMRGSTNEALIVRVSTARREVVKMIGSNFSVKKTTKYKNQALCRHVLTAAHCDASQSGFTLSSVRLGQVRAFFLRFGGTVFCV